MEIFELLLTEFNNQEIKYYDEGIIESKIIKLEALLKTCKRSEDVNKIYKEIKKYVLELKYMQNLRLIKFILDKFN